MPARSRPITPYLDAPDARRRAAFVVQALPEEVAGFLEPLADGGAAAIAVMQQRPDVFVTIASDVPEVMVCWRAIRDDGDGVLRELRRMVERHDRERFTKVRDQAPERLAAWAPADRAARLVYLRGSARTDADGAPPRALESAVYGRDTVAVDEAGIRGLHRLLNERDVELADSALFELLAGVRDEQVVYLDTPDSAARERELSRFTAAVAARGARVLAPRPWPGLVRLAPAPSADDDEALWGSRALR